MRGVTMRLGPFPPGTPYSASDPELMLWVHATLVHSSLAAYERFVCPLSNEDQERYYQEMSVVPSCSELRQPSSPPHSPSSAKTSEASS